MPGERRSRHEGRRAGMGAPRYQVTGAGRSIGQSATIRGPYVPRVPVD
jgi:hypothetical protein